jgi:hypothetical protein
MRSGPCLCGDPACFSCGGYFGDLQDDTEVVAVFPDEDRSETMFYGDLPDGYEWEDLSAVQTIYQCGSVKITIWLPF